MKIRRITSMLVVLMALSTTGSFGSAVAIENHSTDLDFAQVTFVEAELSSDGSWCLRTTVRHNDEGWDHYADAWQVLDEAGNVLGRRLLAHPHDEEQPFTREQCDIEIPGKKTTIVVRAKCNVHGFGGQQVLVDLSINDTDRFRVIRKKP